MDIKYLVVVVGANHAGVNTASRAVRARQDPRQ